MAASRALRLQPLGGLGRQLGRGVHPAAIKAGLCVRTVRRGDREVLVTDLRMHELRHGRLAAAPGGSLDQGAAEAARPQGRDAALNRYGHLYPDEFDSLVERLKAVHERARSEATATSATQQRPECGPES